MTIMFRTLTLMCYSQCGCWWYLCSYVALGFGTACSLLYLVENRAWIVMFLRKLCRPSSFQAKFRLGSLKVSLRTCLHDFHSGLLSKGPEESADGDHDHHLRHHHLHKTSAIIGFGPALDLRAGRSSVELYHILSSKPLATGCPTSNSRKP